MQVLSLSTDAEILRPNSPVAARMAAYAAHVDALHIIVYTKMHETGPACVQLAPKLFVYPTRTPARSAFFRVAYDRAVAIVDAAPTATWVLTTQDPFETGLVGAWIHRKYKMPWQVQVHTDFLNPAFKTSWMQRLRAWVGMSILRRADTIRVVSHRIKDSIVAAIPLLADRVTVLPIFVDTAAIAKASAGVDLHAQYPGRTPIILMASRLTTEKQIPLAIDAVKQFAVTYPHTLLLVVGEGDQRAALESYAKRVNAPVVFVPWVDGVFVQYKSADIFLNTSAFEGYGRTLIEAHAAGLPIVSTDVGVAREVIATAADGVVAAQNATALAAALTTVAAAVAGGVRPNTKTTPQSFATYMEAFVGAWEQTVNRARN